MNNTILCTIDFSEASKDVLKYAVNLSRERKNHITVLYAYRLAGNYNGATVDVKRRIEAEAKAKFKVLEMEVLSRSGVSYDFNAEVGFVSHRISEFARKNKVSFLVMGKKMVADSKEVFDDLAENLHVPLVVVP